MMGFSFSGTAFSMRTSRKPRGRNVAPGRCPSSHSSFSRTSSSTTPLFWMRDCTSCTLISRISFLVFARRSLELMLMLRIYTTCLVKPSIPAATQVIEGDLHPVVQLTKLLFTGIRGHPDRRGFQHDRCGERKRNLELVPAPQLNPALHGNVKAEDRGAGFVGEQHWPLFCDIAGAAGAVDGERRVSPTLDIADKLCERAQPSSRARSAGGTVAESLDALCDRFTIQIHAGHDDDAAIAPIVRRGEDASMPEGEDGATAGTVDFIKVFVAFGTPADSPANKRNDDVSGPSDEASFEALPACE